MKNTTRHKIETRFASVVLFLELENTVQMENKNQDNRDYEAHSDQPMRCYSCGKIMHARYYRIYSNAIDANLSPVDAIALLPQLQRYCCRRMILTFMPIVDDQEYLEMPTFTSK